MRLYLSWPTSLLGGRIWGIDETDAVEPDECWLVCMVCLVPLRERDSFSPARAVEEDEGDEAREAKPLWP